MSMLKEELQDHENLFKSLISFEPLIELGISKLSNVLSLGGKILLCGNGGSASDSQHIAAEFTGRFVKNRKPLAAISLTTDTSALTAISNDFSFSEIFSRQLEAIGKEGDLLLSFSTSGNSDNVIKAVNKAKELGIFSICLLGKDGGALKDICDLPIVVPSFSTARIQESHIFIGHVFCSGVESALGFN